MPPLRLPYSRISRVNVPYFYKFKNLALIKIGLQRNGRTTKPECFIDTGAQFCMFNNAYAKYLGIKDYKDVKQDYIIPLMGIGGKEPGNTAYFHKVNLLIYPQQNHLKDETALVLKDIEIAFLEKDFDVGGILGVLGFLDRVSFMTNIPDGYFEVSPLFDA